MSLKPIMEEICRSKFIAKSEVDENPLSTYNNRIANKKRAIEDLDNLFVKYRFEATKTASVFFGFGNAAQKLGEAIKENVVDVDFNELFDKIVGFMAVEGYIGKRVTPFTFDLIMHGVTMVFNQIGIEECPYLNYDTKYDRHITTKDDMINLVRDIICENIGPEAVTIYAVHVGTHKAIAEEYVGKIMPIYIYAEDNETIGHALKVGRSYQQKFAYLKVGNVSKQVKESVRFSHMIDKLTEETTQQTMDKIINILVKGE